jgi:uncharacterized membrane protein YbhN (UPF0104 family)
LNDTAPLPVDGATVDIAASGVRNRTRALLDRALAVRTISRDRPLFWVLLAAGAAVFAVSIAFSVRDLRDSDASFDPVMLVIVTLVGVPLAFTANVFEYRVMGRMLGHRFPAVEAMRVSATASVANLLPIPGSALVRLRAARQAGSGYGDVIRASAIIGLAFTSTTGIAGGAMLLVANASWLGAALLIGGIVLAGIAIPASRAAHGATTPLIIALFGAELLSVSAAAFRMSLCLLAFDADVSLDAAVALVVADVAAAAIGFLPGGLGIRELLSAAIAPTVGLAASVGVLAAAADRVCGLIGLGLIVLALTVHDRRAR